MDENTNVARLINDLTSLRTAAFCIYLKIELTSKKLDATRLEGLKGNWWSREHRIALSVAYNDHDIMATQSSQALSKPSSAHSVQTD